MTFSRSFQGHLIFRRGMIQNDPTLSEMHQKT